jgi:hypothetical protein
MPSYRTKSAVLDMPKLRIISIRPPLTTKTTSVTLKLHSELIVAKVTGRTFVKRALNLTSLHLTLAPASSASLVPSLIAKKFAYIN